MATSFPACSHVTCGITWRNRKKARIEPSNLRGHRAECGAEALADARPGRPCSNTAATISGNDNSSAVYGAVTVRGWPQHFTWTRMLNLHNDPMACGQLPSIAELRKWVSATWASVTLLARGGSRRAPRLAQAPPTIYSALGAHSKGCGFVLSVNGSWWGKSALALW